MITHVTWLVGPPKAGLNWNESPWNKIHSEQLQNYMGEKPSHFPKTQVKVACDHAALYVMFLVEDQYVRALATRHQERVCQDSCVEFFFTPDADVSIGYFNIEVNCGGTMLFHFHEGPDNQRVEIPVSECDKMIKAHSLPRIVNPEIQAPVKWTVEYSIPLELLKRYCQVKTPQPEVKWRANFYKCADDSSHPHWLTWSPVDYPKPNFHLPRYFGTLVFE